MELSMELKQAIENQVKGIPLQKLQRISNDLTKGYRREVVQKKPFVSTVDEAKVYASVRMPATFGAVSFALEQLKEYDLGKIESVLDVGAGTGAGTWAIYSNFSIKEVCCLEKEKAMMQVGKALMHENKGLECITSWQSFDLMKDSINQTADFVIASYMLNELSFKARQEKVKMLYEATDNILFIVEPGTPEGFLQIKKIRDDLISLGAHIIAPCPHDKTCLIQEPDWCHFSARIARSKLHKQIKGGDVPYEDEKFCYIAVSKTPIVKKENRILRHPITDKGRVRLILCKEEGIMQETITKKQKDYYKAARKAKWGDTI